MGFIDKGTCEKGKREGEAGMSMGFRRHGLNKQYCTNNGSL